MSLAAYKVLHLAGVMLLFMALGGLAMVAWIKPPDAEAKPLRALLAASHGLALILILVAGFGALARLGFMAPSSWGTWVYAKLAIWLLLGASVALIRRMPNMARSWYGLLPVFGAAAAAFAIYKL